MKKYAAGILVSLALVSALIVVGFLNIAGRPDIALGSGQTISGFTVFATSSTALVTSSSNLLVATNTARFYLRVSNLSGNAIYCTPSYHVGTSTNMNNAPAVANSGITIFASSTYEVKVDENPYRGPLYCISPSGNATVSIVEI